MMLQLPDKMFRKGFKKWNFPTNRKISLAENENAKDIKFEL